MKMVKHRKHPAQIHHHAPNQKYNQSLDKCVLTAEIVSQYSGDRYKTRLTMLDNINKYLRNGGEELQSKIMDFLQNPHMFIVQQDSTSIQPRLIRVCSWKLSTTALVRTWTTAPVRTWTTAYVPTWTTAHVPAWTTAVSTPVSWGCLSVPGRCVCWRCCS